MKIYIVEDDPIISQALSDLLTSHQYQVMACQDFGQVAQEVFAWQADLVLLDINLPKQNGYYWCSQIRVQSQVPIIFISSLTDQMDQVIALQMGGDDYLTKPIDRQLTLAKIQALLRRTYNFQQDPISVLNFKGFMLNQEKLTLSKSGQSIDLTATEYQILLELFKREGAYARREDILDACWQDEHFIDDNTLAVNISRIRKKLDHMGFPDLIETKKRVGYRLVCPEED